VIDALPLLDAAKAASDRAQAGAAPPAPPPKGSPAPPPPPPAPPGGLEAGLAAPGYDTAYWAWGVRPRVEG
jgi:hypothetical protein